MDNKTKQVWAILADTEPPKEGDQCRWRGADGKGFGRWRKVTNFNGGHQMPGYIYRTPIPLRAAAEKPVDPFGGLALSLDEAEAALREAMDIISSVGTTGIYDKYKAARDWMRRYFPSYAEPGTW